jgi:hypothetical protein
LNNKKIHNKYYPFRIINTVQLPEILPKKILKFQIKKYHNQIFSRLILAQRNWEIKHYQNQDFLAINQIRKNINHVQIANKIILKNPINN